MNRHPIQVKSIDQLLSILCSSYSIVEFYVGAGSERYSIELSFDDQYDSEGNNRVYLFDKTDYSGKFLTIRDLEDPACSMIPAAIADGALSLRAQDFFEEADNMCSREREEELQMHILHLLENEKRMMLPAYLNKRKAEIVTLEKAEAVLLPCKRLGLMLSTEKRTILAVLLYGSTLNPLLEENLKSHYDRCIGLDISQIANSATTMEQLTAYLMEDKQKSWLYNLCSSTDYPPEEPKKWEYPVGTVVRHSEYGKGIVIEISKNRRDIKIKFLKPYEIKEFWPSHFDELEFVSEVPNEEDFNSELCPVSFEFDSSGKWLMGCESGPNIEITIPEGITVIVHDAFANNPFLRRITLPESMARIGDRAFYHCVNLEEINFPASIKRIGEQAFAGCPKIKRPENLAPEVVHSTAFEQ